MSYTNITIEPGNIPGLYSAAASEDDGYQDPDELIENMSNAGLALFELGVDNLPANLDIRAAIDIAPQRVFYAIPDDDGLAFYFGIAAQH